jgi:hypothetical protein
MHRHGNTYTNDKTFAKRFEEDHEDIMIACITAQTDAGKSEVDEDPVYQLVDVEI